MADPIDWTNPCERAVALRAAYYRLVSGAQEERVRYEGNGVLREVHYSRTDMNLLLQEIREAERLCADQTGETQPRRRFAIAAGSRRIMR